MPSSMLSEFVLVWSSAGKAYDVYYKASVPAKHVCRVFPYNGEEGTLNDSKKMFTVKAENYPGVGNLEQMVKGADLLPYLDSIRMGRGM